MADGKMRAIENRQLEIGNQIDNQGADCRLAIADGKMRAIESRQLKIDN
jgi:hypothetical protein